MGLVGGICMLVYLEGEDESLISEFPRNGNPNMLGEEDATDRFISSFQVNGAWPDATVGFESFAPRI
jgi:hypothetical protein